MSVFHRTFRPRRAVCAVAAAALLGPAALSCGFRGEPASQRTGPEDGRGLNILLTGIDQRRNLSQDEKDRLHVNGKECNCTDVMMLLHISADRKRVSGVSIPRDSYVPFAPHNGAPKKGKINAAFKHGGPKLAMRTVQRLTGVEVHHYAQVDFPRFVRTMDSLGGAELCSERKLSDVNSGLRLDAGVHRLTGKEALAYVRARHVSPPGDLGRNRRQQYLLASVLTGLTSGQSPTQLARTVRAFKQSVHTDKGLTSGKLLRLGEELRGLDAEHTEFATVPMSDFDLRVPGWGSSLKWDDKRAKELFRTLGADRPLTSNPKLHPPRGTKAVGLPPRTVPVQVAGGGPHAERLQQALRKDGFRVLDGDAAGASTSAQSPKKGAPRITYNPSHEPQAQVVAAALPDATLQRVSGHPTHATVWPGSKDVTVRRVVEDRSSVEGAAVTGDRVGGCKRPENSAG